MIGAQDIGHELELRALAVSAVARLLFLKPSPLPQADVNFLLCTFGSPIYGERLRRSAWWELEHLQPKGWADEGLVAVPKTPG